jgi:hypothetical protein
MPPALTALKGFSPLDAELALGSSCYSPRLVESLVLLGASMPFRQGVQVLRHFTAVTVAEATVRRQTERAGAQLKAAQDEQGAQLLATTPIAPATPATLQVSVDGAMVPLVEGKWAEVKTLAVGEVSSQVAADGELRVETSNLSYYSRLSNAEQFSTGAWLELWQRGVEQAARVVAVNDGADWIQTFLDLNCPQAVRILDFSHAAEHLAHAGEECWASASAEFKAWYEQQCAALKAGAVAQVIGAVRALGDSAALRAEVNYLSKRRAQMAYQTYRTQGLPIGSGIVESANKLVVEARLKGAGMHWQPRHVNPMVSLRNAICSERWEGAWAQVVAQQQSQRQRAKGAAAAVGGSAAVTKVRQAAREARGRSVVRAGAQASGASRIAKQGSGAEQEAKPRRSSAHKPAPDHPWYGKYRSRQAN